MASYISEEVKDLFRKEHNYQAEYAYLKSRIALNEPMNPEQCKRFHMLKGWLSCFNSLLLVLNEDELFIIKRHLIDGIDWNRIIIEYNEKWGPENGRNRRTLIRYQNSALKKISDALEFIKIPTI